MTAHRLSRRSVRRFATRATARGGHFILLKPGKKSPIERVSWQRYVPTAEEAADHYAAGGNLGFIPDSLGLLTLDLDHGDGSMIEAVYHGYILRKVPSSTTPGRFHYYLAVPAGDRYRTTFDFGSDRGEIKHDRRGYAMIHSLPDLDATLDDLDAAKPLPANLLAPLRASRATPAPHHPAKRRPRNASPPRRRKTKPCGPNRTAGLPEYIWRIALITPTADVRIGMRDAHVFVLAVTQLAASRSPAAHAAILSRLRAINAQLADPLPDRQLAQKVRSAAKWIGRKRAAPWILGGYTREQQVRGGLARGRQVAAIAAPLQRHALRLRRQGDTYRTIARKQQCSPSTARARTLAAATRDLTAGPPPKPPPPMNSCPIARPRTGRRSPSATAPHTPHTPPNLARAPP